MTSIQKKNSMLALPKKVRILIQKKQEAALQKYMAGAMVIGVITWFHMSHLSRQHEINVFANARINEYVNSTLDLCVFHQASAIHPATNQLHNVMVIKQKTGEIIYNSTLECSPAYLVSQLKDSPNDYCADLMSYINNKTIDGNEVLFNMFNRGSLTNRVMECTMAVNDSNTYIHRGYMAHLFSNRHVYKEKCAIAWVILYLVYAVLCYNDYDNLNIHARFHMKLPEGTECYIMYQPIKPWDTYYKCYRCVAVYGYNAIAQYWAYHAKKCPYCSTPINYLTRFINAKG